MGDTILFADPGVEAWFYLLLWLKLSCPSCAGHRTRSCSVAIKVSADFIPVENAESGAFWYLTAMEEFVHRLGPVSHSFKTNSLTGTNMVLRRAISLRPKPLMNRS